MTKISPLSGLLLLLFFLATSCDEKDKDPVPSKDLPEAGHGIKKQQKYLLRTVEWKSFGQTAAYTYNSDSTIKKVSQVGSGNYIYFRYQNEALTEMALEASDYKNTYAYNPAGQMISWTRAQKQASYGSTFVFEYKYNATGTVSEMDYFKINEAGKQLVYHNVYEYSSQNLLSKVTATASNGYKVIWTIDSYSAPFDFDPWVFISHDLAEKYEIYNYPVLSRLNQLPKKITKTVIGPGQTAQVEEVVSIDFTITQEKLEKMVNTVAYPGHPELNSSYEVLYSYY
ncbi:hypothetical protein [Rufibacter hautae]|uniref:DUF4595 domain-containing protein n=1 Tax=Rufibacter hautae TaxID=2595005 RepID=A0A5B6TI75_9BACT|nr:hypothetical protein [Rufibacter hautae]KAA3439696.1 hypothetical protein FOA19_03180 [Rufibacter hautae]